MQPVTECALFSFTHGYHACLYFCPRKVMQKSADKYGFVIRVGHDKKHVAVCTNPQIGKFTCGDHSYMSPINCTRFPSGSYMVAKFFSIVGALNGFARNFTFLPESSSYCFVYRINIDIKHNPTGVRICPFYFECSPIHNHGPPSGNLNKIPVSFG